MKKVIIHKDKEKAILQNRHPWIFSGAIKKSCKGIRPGDIASIFSEEGTFLAKGYFNMDNSLCGRILSFEDLSIEEIVEKRIEQAKALRLLTIDLEKINAFRLVNAEEDGLPGLIVDLYGAVAVIQINTQGMEKLRSLVVDTLVKVLSPSAVYEKSVSSARGLEGLLPVEGFLYGQEVEEVLIWENGVQFLVSVVDGQKTGFFLDQREMRKKIGELAKGKRVLNCFSYSGGFSMHALHGGALEVTSVDVCPKAVELSRRNSALNGFDRHTACCADVFDFLEEEDLSRYDLIILDPPAFAKKRGDIPRALEGYRKLFHKAFTKSRPGTILLASSCSYYIDALAFKQALFKAASSSKKNIQILSGHIQAMDHPISLFHPEGEYLKSFLLYIC